MPYLEGLDISESVIENIEFMKEMPFKETLEDFISVKNKISDLSPLGEFLNLKMINVHLYSNGNKIDNNNEEIMAKMIEGFYKLKEGNHSYLVKQTNFDIFRTLKY